MSPEMIVGRVFGVNVNSLTDTTSNRSLKEWDSLAHMTLIVELEAVYGIVLSAEDALTMTDVGSIKRLLHARGVTW
jgi:citrate synthase